MLSRQATSCAAGIAAILAIAFLGTGWAIDRLSRPPVDHPAQTSAYSCANCNCCNNQPNEPFWERTIHDPVALWTLVLAIFTGVLGGVSLGQFHYLRRADETARIAAQAAQKSAETGERALIDLERAYIFGGPGHKDGTYGNFIITVTIENYGKTPGFLEEVCWGLCPEERFHQEHMFEKSLLFEDILGPSMTEARAFPMIQSRFSGRSPCISYGRICYRDIFGKRHYSGWKHRIHPDMHDDVLVGAYSDWT